MCSGRPLEYRSGQFNDTKSTTSALILDETTVPPIVEQTVEIFVVRNVRDKVDNCRFVSSAPPG